MARQRFLQAYSVTLQNCKVPGQPLRLHKLLPDPGQTHNMTQQTTNLPVVANAGHDNYSDTGGFLAWIYFQKVVNYRKTSYNNYPFFCSEGNKSLDNLSCFLYHISIEKQKRR